MTTKTKSQTVADANTVLDRLERVVRWSDGFTLAFVKCNHPVQREGMRRALLARLSDKRVLEVSLEKPIISLLDELTARWNADQPPNAVCVYGLEKSVQEQREASPVLGRLNHDRELIRRAIPTALLIWLPDFALDYVARGAPDFWAWRSGVYEFSTVPELWQVDTLAVLATDMPALFSLPLEDKQKEIARLEELLRTARSLSRQGKGEQETIARLLFQLGLLYQSLGEWDTAQARYEEGLKINQRLGDQRGIARTLQALGNVHYLQGNYPEAIRLYEQALGIFRQLGDQRGIAGTLHQMGNVHYSQGDYAEAVHLYEQALDTFRQLGDQHGIALTLHSMGNIHYDQENYTEAVWLYEQSLAIKRQLGAQDGIAITLHQMGMIHEEQGNYAEAMRLYEEALGTFRQLGDQHGVATTLHQLGGVHYDQGNYAEAMRLYEQALNISRKLGDRDGVAGTLYQIGLLYQRESEFRLAMKQFLSAAGFAAMLRHPNLRLAVARLGEIKSGVGAGQFAAWWRELMPELGEAAAGLVNLRPEDISKTPMG